ncbi:phosphatase PAP2 family protein [Halosolutus gelatinilyticus]|uniref:phosphatase PAP2 family protein n=1 Tax=Halosolutus gelatinilyticus TaxID=2931975 RepID=UPI001FF241AF|nr:phosphatase PAP2 family protein [Halosolutus gelatinilyticus]
MRFESESAGIWEAFPDAYAGVAAVVTEFGGPTALMFVLALLYWLTRRRETALVISYAVAGVSFILLLKLVIGLPRPPEEVFLVPNDDDPYGFPSGHAFAATLVYGGLLLTFDRYRDPLAIGAATSAVVLVSLSRVVLGVHYLGDVIAGAIVGLAFLVAVHAIVAGDPRRGFALGGAIAVPAVLVTGGESDVLIALGGSVGGLLASTRLGSLPDLRSRLEGALLVVVGIGAIVVGVVLESLAAAIASTLVAAIALTAVNAGLFVAILLAPAVVGRVSIGSASVAR